MNVPDVSIRPIELGDAKNVEKYASEEQLARTCNVPHPYPENGGEFFVKQRIESREKKKQFSSAILLIGNFVGVIGLNDPDFKKRSIQVDYWVGVPFWGKGIASKAVSLAVEYAIKELAIETIFSGCWEGNPASCRVLGKNGFNEIESMINDGKYGQKFIDERIRCFKLTKEEWTQMKSD